MTLFEKIINREIPSKIIYEDDDTLAFLDITQKTPGHTLIVPKKPVINAMEASDDIIALLNVRAVKVAKILQEKLHCKGFNFLTNASQESGQTIFHYHIHILPRWEDDEMRLIFKDHNYSIDSIFEILNTK